MNGRDENEVTLELKYCERCGGLWLRECSSPEVYCLNCQPAIADLPPRRKRPVTVRLPIAPGVAFDYVDELEFLDDDDIDARASGGVA